jgi:hypothetical protein
MWSVRRENNNTLSQLPWPERCLSRIELQQILLKYSRAQNNIFVMSQSFSGGFHRMSVDIQPFEINANPRICGFTAITEDNFASSGRPDVSGPNYQGYERYMTQQITGRDVVTGRIVQPPRNSVRDAHEFATLQDFTVDIPLSTSDYFLWKWSVLLDQPDYVPRTADVPVGTTRKLYRAAFLGSGDITDPSYLRRRVFVQAMNQRIMAFDRVAGSVVYSGNPEGMQNLLIRLSREVEGSRAQYDSAVSQKTRLLKRYMIPAWEREVVNQPSSPVLNDRERDIEMRALLKWEKGDESYDKSLLWFLSLLTIKDPPNASMVSQFDSERIQRRMKWASQHPSAELRSAASEIQRIDTYLLQKENEILLANQRIGLIRRSLIYRSALAAWSTLVKLEDEAARIQLNGLLECEATPLF